MANAIVDLWPEISLEPDLVTPITVLKQQALLLGQKTGNLVEARVDTSSTESGKIVHAFTLVGPALNYSYRLLSVRHSIECYPLTLFIEGDMFGEEVQDHEALLDELQKVFSDEKTLRVIHAIIAQSRS